MPDNLQAIRDYASSLQGDERKAFIDKFNSIKNDDAKVSTLVSRISTISNTEPKQNDTMQNIKTGAGVVAAVGGAGALAYGATRYINAPNRMMKPIEKQLEGIAKKEIGKVVATSDLPSLLTAKHNDFRANTIRPSLDAVNQNHKVQSATIRNNRNLFDQRVINPAIDSTAKHISDNYKTFVNSGYESYRVSQNAIESIIEQTGQSLRSDDIVNNLFSKTLTDSIDRGVPEHLLSKLSRLSSAFESEENIVDLLGNKIQTSEPIPFSQIKGNVAYLLKELPDGARHALADNWSSYMAKYVPEQARGIFDDMQKQYAKFAPARNALFDLVNRNTGSFDTKKLSTRLRNLVKTNQDAGLTELLGVLKQGTETTKPIAGLAEKVDGLLGLSQQRNDYATQLINLEKNKEMAIQGAKQVDDLLNAGKQNYTKAYRQTQELLSQKNAIMEKYPIRTALTNSPKMLVKGLETAVKLGGKLAVGLPFGVVASEAEKRGGGYDPAEAFQIWLDSKKPEMTEGQIEKLKAIGWIAGPVGYMIGGSIGITAKEKKATEEKYQRMYQNAMGI